MSSPFSTIHNYIFLEILNHMDFPSLLSLKQTSTITDTYISVFLNSKLRTLLARFLDHPEMFRTLLRDTDSIISGSSALQFVLPVYINWESKDLDIYTPNGVFDTVVDHLKHVQGFIRTPFPRNELYDRGGIDDLARMKNGPICVDVIRSNTHSALHPLPFFWLTAAINVISADSTYIAYPKPTFDAHALINPIDVTTPGIPLPRVLPLIQKYQSRGFDIRVREPSWCHEPENPDGTQGKHTGCCPCATRVLGDQFSIHANLTRYCEPVEDLITKQGVTVLWCRGGPPCEQRCKNPNSAPSVLEVTDVRTTY